MSSEALTLSIETAVGKGSLALLQGETTLGVLAGGKQSSRSAELLPEIERLLETCGRRREDLTRIAVSIGPGSPTGARVGIAAAKALALALGAECIGVSVLEAAAYEAWHRGVPAKRFCAALSAGKSGFYFQDIEISDEGVLKAGSEKLFGDAEQLSENLEREPDAVLVFAGDAAEEPENHSFNIEAERQIFIASDKAAEINARYALRILHKNSGRKASETLEPLYIREDSFKKIGM